MSEAILFSADPEVVQIEDVINHLKENEFLYWETGARINKSNFEFPLVGYIHIKNLGVKYRVIIEYIKPFEEDHYLGADAPKYKPIKWINEYKENPDDWNSTYVISKIDELENTIDTKSILKYDGGKVTHPPQNYIKIIDPREGKEEIKMDEEKEQPQNQIDIDFNKYKDKGQIEFITFHPSYSYEDFIEGIRPRLNTDDNSQVSFEIKDGIFKKLSIRAIWSAIKNMDENKSIASFDEAYRSLLESIDEKNETFATVRGKEFLLTHNDNDNLIAKPKESIREKGYIISKARLSKLILEKDKVAKPSDIRPVIGGCNSSIYFAVFLKVKELLGNTPNKELDFVEDYELIKERVLNILDKGGQGTINFSNASKFVLIIDEINRGDISKIFGELITLIEEDKRLTSPNELTVTLPNSGEKFSIPPNLYIIGTMNTADRSLALVDIALRRRFDFKEMRPEINEMEDNPVKYGCSEKVKGSSSFKLSINAIKNLNEVLGNNQDIGKDKKIGHAFFCNIKAEEENEIERHIIHVWQSKILPLLEEYYFFDRSELENISKKKYTLLNGWEINKESEFEDVKSIINHFAEYKTEGAQINE